MHRGGGAARSPVPCTGRRPAVRVKRGRGHLGWRPQVRGQGERRWVGWPQAQGEQVREGREQVEVGQGWVRVGWVQQQLGGQQEGQRR